MADITNPDDVIFQGNNRAVDNDPRDWRFRIRLAPQSDALYRSGNPGILQPLTVTDGVVFPYTPQIMVNYQANYSESTPTHSNYKQYFYQSSQISDIQITGTFTAQSTKEADYLLAATHFFRSCTKMFYGQDANRGNPPPLVFLEGFGDNQFNEHPCVVQQFNYVLPPDVDYVRTSGQGNRIDLSEQRVARNGYKSPLIRLFELFNNGISKGAETPYYGNRTGDLSSAQSSYVPTKIEFMITLHPIISRNKMSSQFGLDGGDASYSSGAGLQRGIW